MHLLPLSLESSQAWLLTYALNALWQVPVVFAAAWIAARTSRRAGPAFQHALWTTALFAEVLLPACSARPTQILQVLVHWLPFRRTALPQTAHVTVTMGTPHAAAGFHFPPALLATAALLYLAAIVFFAIRLAIGLHQTASLRRRAEPLDLTGYARQSYHRYAQLFAVHQPLVATSAEIASPITLGIRRPTLLLPAHLDTALLSEDLDAILAHEFAHMRRRDFTKNLLYQLLSLPIAFHPALWLTRSRMAETRELVCDAMAANAVAGRQRYARSLLRLATQFSQRAHAPTPHAIGIFDAHPFKNFERRVMNLTHHPMELRGAARYATTALSIVLIGGACTSALAFRQQVTAPPPQTTTIPSTIKIELAPTDIGPSNVNIGSAPTGTGPSTVILPVPHPTVGQAAPSIKIEWAGTSGPSSQVKVLRPEGQPDPSIRVYTAEGSNPNPVVKVFTKVVVQPTQTNTVSTIQIRPGDMTGNVLNHPGPIYPPDAKAAGIQGSVILDAVIGKDGMISSLKLVSGPPELTKAAWEAVKQWTYKPYLLNGDPVPVETTITVNFTLTK